MEIYTSKHGIMIYEANKYYLYKSFIKKHVAVVLLTLAVTTVTVYSRPAVHSIFNKQTLKNTISTEGISYTDNSGYNDCLFSRFMQ